MPSKSLVLITSLLVVPSVIYAGDHGGCLGHHWHDPEYQHELLWQCTALGIIFMFCAAGKVFSRIKGRLSR